MGARLVCGVIQAGDGGKAARAEGGRRTGTLQCPPGGTTLRVADSCALTPALQVANELTTRMERVLLVSRDTGGGILTAEVLQLDSKPIESAIVERLVAAHQQHIASTLALS